MDNQRLPKYRIAAIPSDLFSKLQSLQSRQGLVSKSVNEMVQDMLRRSSNSSLGEGTPRDYFLVAMESPFMVRDVSECRPIQKWTRVKISEDDFLYYQKVQKYLSVRGFRVTVGELLTAEILLDELSEASSDDEPSLGDKIYAILVLTEKNTWRLKKRVHLIS
jgi:hypothetical protein